MMEHAAQTFLSVRADKNVCAAHSTGKNLSYS